MAFARDNTIEIYINSEIDKGVDDTTASWRTQFDNSLRIPNEKTLEIAIKTVAAPNTAPQFADNEKTFTVLQEGESSQSVTLDQTRVFASTADFLTYLATTLNALPSVNVTIAQVVETKKVSITNNSAGYLRLYQSNFWNKVGYTTDDDYIEIAASGVELSSRITELIRTQRYYLCCPDVFNNAKTKDSNYSQIIGCIDLESSFGTYSSEQLNYLYFHTLTNTNNLDGLSFYLMDDKRRRVEMLLGGSVNIGLIARMVD